VFSDNIHTSRGSGVELRVHSVLLLEAFVNSLVTGLMAALDAEVKLLTLVVNIFKLLYDRHIKLSGFLLNHFFIV
jgi:predicted lysophospholipase L1 biosynthesis ABC-type transport system permease subunit